MNAPPTCQRAVQPVRMERRDWREEPAQRHESRVQCRECRARGRLAALGRQSIAGHPGRQITKIRRIEIERALRTGSARTILQSAVEPDGNQIAGKRNGK